MKYIRKTFDALSLDELYKILKLRNEVFIVEQDCPYLDIDDIDQRSIHLWLEEDGNILAYLRVIKPGILFDRASIGRVISKVRKKGYASILLNKAIDICINEFNSNEIEIEAQYYACSLYEKLGFVQTSEIFKLDGIDHIKMIYKSHD